LKSTDLLQAEDKGSTGNMFSSLDRHLRQHWNCFYLSYFFLWIIFEK
jgi:hypothetical protein